MNNTQEDIKQTCEGIYKELANINKRLVVIRATCQHPNQSEKLYSWREGSYLPADICNDCGHLIKLKFPEMPTVLTTHSVK